MGSHSRRRVAQAMGGRAGKPPKQKPKVKDVSRAGPFAGLFAAARGEAGRRGLWLLVEGDAADPLWRIYDAGDGSVLGCYAPLSRALTARGRRRLCESWRHAFDVILAEREQ